MYYTELRFPGGEKVRELHDTREEVRVDLDANGNMVGLGIAGAISVRVLNEDDPLPGNTIFEAEGARE